MARPRKSTETSVKASPHRIGGVEAGRRYRILYFQEFDSYPGRRAGDWDSLALSEAWGAHSRRHDGAVTDADYVEFHQGFIDAFFGDITCD